MVLTADKEVAMVVMDRKEYQDKVEGLLATYRTISTDLTNKLKVQLIKKLRRIKNETNMEFHAFNACTAKYLIPKLFRASIKFSENITRVLTFKLCKPKLEFFL